MKGEMDDSNY
jgi:hypothetical protein